jgi:hypothetical protein
MRSAPPILLRHAGLDACAMIPRPIVLIEDSLALISRWLGGRSLSRR